MRYLSIDFMQFIIINREFTVFGGNFAVYPNIRALREDNDITQKKMAEYLHCSQQVYSNYELGQRDIPTDILIKLALFYDVSTDYILGLTENPKQNR